MRREQIGVLLCFALILPALMMMPVQGSADDSFFTVTVVDLKFHVEVDLRIWLSIDDLSQFVDARDSYSKEQGGFRSALLESIESGVQELVPSASVTELVINRIECDIPGKEMFVSLSFNIDDAIRKGDTIEYDLNWRHFIAVKKFSSADRRVQPAEALGLDFHDFKDELPDWTIKTSSGNTVIERKETYELNADDGTVGMKLTMKFTLPGTDMTVGVDTVTSKKTTADNGITSPLPIPGFPWEAIGIGAALAVAVIITQRKGQTVVRLPF